MLAPCPERLRVDAGHYLIALISRANLNSGELGIQLGQQSSENLVTNILPKGSSISMTDILFRRFIGDVCKNSFDIRRKSVATVADDSVRGKPNKVGVDEPPRQVGREQAASAGFFSSWWATPNSQEFSFVAIPMQSAAVGKQPLHQLQHIAVGLQQRDEQSLSGSWCGYLPITAVELALLISTLEASGTSQLGTSTSGPGQSGLNCVKLASANENFDLKVNTGIGI